MSGVSEETLAPAAAATARVPAIDALRGVVMIIMALDHVREYFHADAMLFQPDDLTRTTIALFFTRWITHICAPVFCFLAGTGTYLWARSGRRTLEVSRFLLARGFWLIVLELTVLRVAMNFSYLHGLWLLSILWALGWAMIALAGLIWLPLPALAALSVAGMALHNVTDRLPAAAFGRGAWLWEILHQPGVFEVRPATVLVAYPLVPWVFVMSAGYCFGRVIAMDARDRRRRIIQLGWLLTLAFGLIRFVNRYGDPRPWRVVPGVTWLSFLRITKYPPSLDFLLITLGVALLLLASLDRVPLSRQNPLLVFGGVPLFYFLGHLVLLHALAVVLALARYGTASFLFGPLPDLGGTFPAGYGYSLPVVYVVWGTVVMLMYPACRWFARVKQQRRDWWLRYL